MEDKFQKQVRDYENTQTNYLRKQNEQHRLFWAILIIFGTLFGSAFYLNNL